MGWHGDEELSPLGDEEASLRARWSGVTGDPVVVVSVFLFEDFLESLAGEHIDSSLGKVIEKIVGFPAMSPDATCFLVSVSKTGNCAGFIRNKHQPGNGPEAFSAKKRKGRAMVFRKATRHLQV